MTRRDWLAVGGTGVAATLLGGEHLQGAQENPASEGGNRRRCEAADFLKPADVPENQRWQWDLVVPKRLADANKGYLASAQSKLPPPPPDGQAPMYLIQPLGYIRTDEIQAAASQADPIVNRIYPNPDGTGEPITLDIPLGKVNHGVAPEFWRKIGNFDPADFWRVNKTIAYYEVRTREFRGSIIPPAKGDDGQVRPVVTTLWGYNGQVPGPVYKIDAFRPVLVRYINELNTEVSVHLHGGHTPAHSDGHPSFLICPGRARDYFYPHGAPKETNGSNKWDETEIVSTMWYHDHANDITAHNALMGLSSFWITMGEHEKKLVADHKLPAEEQDIPLALSDRCIRKDGFLHFDPFDHNGYLGSFMLCNGRAFAKLKVKPWKYRFRILDGALARFFRLEFRLEKDLDVKPSHKEQDKANYPALPFCRIGKDSWLYPKGLPNKKSVFLGMANRADIIFDFAAYAGQTIYLVETLNQRDGRGPGHGDNEDGAPGNAEPRGNIDDPPLRTDKDDLDDHPVVRILKIEVEAKGENDPCTFDENVELTPHEDYRKLSQEEIAKLPVREFDFERRKGAWQVNHLFFDEERADAIPNINGPNGGMERWILRNRSGGWWHPIHIHLESHQHLRQFRGFEIKNAAGEVTGEEERERALPDEDKFKHDTTVLGPNMTVEILMRFRTFLGPFVFHCHNLNHEDMRMMQTLDPREQWARGPIPVRPERWFGEPLDGNEPCGQAQGPNPGVINNNENQGGES